MYSQKNIVDLIQKRAVKLGCSALQMLRAAPFGLTPVGPAAEY
jgi:hypothetical protein